MINTDRSLRARMLQVFGRTRTRWNTVAGAGAIAVLAGLSSQAIAVDAVTRDVREVASAHVATATKADDSAKPATPAKASAKPAKAPAKKAKVQAPAKKVAKKPAGFSPKQLHPRGLPGGQQAFQPSKEQLRNASAIVDTGRRMGLPPRAWVIAVATSLQESTLRNLGHLGASNDHDSQGLFQQRPSSGWGSPSQIRNPHYASKAFYKGLVSVSGWNRMPLTAAAQSVQVSAYPDHYAKWERMAGQIVNGFYGSGPYAKIWR